MTRRRPSPALAALLACVAAGVSLGACGATAHHAAVPTPPPTSVPAPATVATSAPSTTTTTSAPATTTTTTLPASPQASPDAASAAFVEAWEGHDRAAAASVATASAVSSLFASAYSGETLNNRGCGAPGPNPVECSWGPYADAPPTDPIYDITVSPSGNEWYVSGVTKLS